MSLFRHALPLLVLAILSGITSPSLAHSAWAHSAAARAAPAMVPAHRLGAIELVTREIRQADGTVDATLETRRGGKLIETRAFAHIDSVGGHAGFVFPAEQPIFGRVFILRKEGDYDTRVILVHPSGKIIDLPGLGLFASDDGKLLFVLRVLESEPYPTYAAYDVPSGRVLLPGEDSETRHVLEEGFAYAIYRAQDGTYLAVGHPGLDSELPKAETRYASLDLKTGTAQRLDAKVGARLAQGARKLKPLLSGAGKWLYARPGGKR